MKLTKSTCTVLFLAMILFSALLSGCGDSGESKTTSSNAAYNDPTGTWTDGDKNSVYTRLTVNSYGTFRFEVVDFTGDVKEGSFSGTWRMEGNSVRFEWGSGGADSGSCTGRRTGLDSLVFGKTTFYNGAHSQNANSQPSASDHPIDPAFAELLDNDRRYQTNLISLLSKTQNYG